ncbi:MAG TPA: hypothetical protein VGF16_16550 [Bryobacteraceae bacterium]|jgi:hypothetical protein
MFDPSKDLEFDVRTPEGNPAKVLIRWPSDEEWIERRRMKRMIVQQLGRGQHQMETIHDTKTDHRIYESIKLNGAPSISGGEASRILDALEQFDIRDVQMPANQATVVMKVYHGLVRHTLQIPSADDIIKYKDGVGSRIKNLPFNKQEMRPRIEHGAEFWDKCKGSSEDYAGHPVPAIHKFAAWEAVVKQLDEEINSRADEDSDDF